MQPRIVMLLLVSLFFVNYSWCQSDELVAMGQTGKLHLLHTVVAKENLYSIGRLYNISPKVIAPFNKLTLDKSLSIGEQLEIPLTSENFSQTGQKMANETLIPVFHIVQDREWMYRVSVNHNKVPIGTLEKWNNINKDQVKPGMHLIVGYLKVKTALSALATGSGSSSVATYNATNPKEITFPAATKPEVSNPATTHQDAVGQTQNHQQPNTTTAPSATPAESKPGNATTTSAPAKSAPAKSSPAKSSPAKSSVSTNSASTGSATSSSATPNSAGTNSATTGSTTPNSASTGSTATGSINFNGGYFKDDFKEEGKSASGLAGIFKSTSGWQDGKYYALMNNVPVGTIVKITIPSSGKSIYAKVLGQLPDMKESTGLAIRISNAAAGELGEAENKFNIDIRF